MRSDLRAGPLADEHFDPEADDSCSPGAPVGDETQSGVLDRPSTNLEGLRHLVDVTGSFTPNESLTLLLNADFGVERIRDTAARMREALTRGDWDATAASLATEWENRKRLAPGVTTPAIETLIARAGAAGARAAKVCGAGGGGCLFCLAEPADVPAVRAALADGGARLLDFRVETTGLDVRQE